MIKDNNYGLLSPFLPTTGDLSSQETAELLHVHVQTIRRWSDERLIESYRIGPRGDRRFRLEDIERFLGERD